MGDAQLACAGQIDLPGGVRVWIPPTGRAYWVGKLPGRAGPDLTDDELRQYGIASNAEQ